LFSIPFLIFTTITLKTDWYITFPLLSWIMYLVFTTDITCPYTDLENKLRKKIGKPKIKGFIYHYYLKNYVRIKKLFR